MNNFLSVTFFLLVIYLIDKQILQPKMLLFYILIILIWNFSIHTRENFNGYIYIGKNPNSDSFKKYYYDMTDKIYTSNDYYNQTNYNLENRNYTLPNNVNLYPKDLQNIVKNTSNTYQCNKGLLEYKNCSSDKILKPVQEDFSVLTPDIPEGTLMENNQKCSIGNHFPLGPGLQNKPPEGCCPQGYSYDYKVNKCKQICRGCKTGVCEKGWCFGNTCGNNNFST